MFLFAVHVEKVYDIRGIQSLENNDKMPARITHASTKLHGIT